MCQGEEVTGHSIEPVLFNKPYAFDKSYDVFLLTLTYLKSLINIRTHPSCAIPNSPMLLCSQPPHLLSVTVA